MVKLSIASQARSRVDRAYLESTFEAVDRIAYFKLFSLARVDVAFVFALLGLVAGSINTNITHGSPTLALALPRPLPPPLPRALPFPRPLVLLGFVSCKLEGSESGSGGV